MNSLSIIGILLFYWLSLIPWSYYSGSIESIITLDNGNIGFQLVVMILFPLIDWINRFESKTINIE